MSKLLSKTLLAGVSAVGLALLAASASAYPVLPVQNLTFSDYSGATPKDYFSAVNPAYWYRGPTAPNSDLVFIDAPGTATQYGGGSNSYPVYGPFADPPPGGNFVQADGNPDFESQFKQDITGLTPGAWYTLTFWQAAGQQHFNNTLFSGATTEQWKVFLGNDPVDLTGPSGGYYGVSYGSNSEADSTLMHTPSKGVSAWNLVSVDLQAPATSTTATLTFLAWGDGGSNQNLPPTVFLAGVNTPAQPPVPEPATLTIFGAGLLGFGGFMASRRKKRAKKA